MKVGYFKNKLRVYDRNGKVCLRCKKNTNIKNFSKWKIFILLCKMSEMKIIILIFFFISSYSFCNSFLKGSMTFQFKTWFMLKKVVMFDKVHGRFVSTAIVGEYEYYEVGEFYKKILLPWLKLVKKIFINEEKNRLS